MTWRTAYYVVTAVSVLAGAVVQARAPAGPQKLIVQWQKQNALCRGLHGDDPRMQPACDERQRLGRALYHIGWCYGEIGQMAYEMRWHRCRENSLPHE